MFAKSNRLLKWYVTTYVMVCYRLCNGMLPLMATVCYRLWQPN
jgi:hypothetical protein